MFYSFVFNCFCFSYALPIGEYVNLACSIILVWSDCNIPLPVRYSYLSILAEEDTDIFAASLLITNYHFSCLILWPIVMINFYILSKRLFLKRGELSDAKVVSITKKEYGFAVHFLQRFIKSISDEWLNAICWSSFFFWNFHNKIVC